MDHPVGVVYGGDELRPDLHPYQADSDARRRAHRVIVCDAVAPGTRASTHEHATLEFSPSGVIGRVSHSPPTNADDPTAKWVGKNLRTTGCATPVRCDQCVERVRCRIEIAFAATCNTALGPLEFGSMNQWWHLEPYCVRVRGVPNRA